MLKGSCHSEESIRKMSAIKKGKHPSEETKRKISKAAKGRTFSLETRKKISDSEKGKIISNETRIKLSKLLNGKIQTNETRRKISESLKGRDFSKEHKRKLAESQKGKHLSEETKKKLSESHRKHYKEEKNWVWKNGKVQINCKLCGKEKYILPSIFKPNKGHFCSYRCNCIWTLKHMKSKDTSIEIAIEEELLKRNVPYLKQTPLEGIALVDFLLPNKIIIQCDGDYWHSKSKTKNRDINQDFILTFKGYKVYRFKESEIKKSARKCVDKIMKDI